MTHRPIKPRDAFGFLFFGLAMWLWPVLAPASFPAPPWGGMNGQQLWLEAMGTIQGALGGALAIKHYAVPALLRWSEIRGAERSTPAFALSRLRGMARL